MKVWLPDRHTQTDRLRLDKVIPMCRYVSQATQKLWQRLKTFQSNSKFKVKVTKSKIILRHKRSCTKEFTCEKWKPCLLPLRSYDQSYKLDLLTWISIGIIYLLIKNYLSTKFEDSGAERSWVISCTRCGRPTWPLTKILIGIIYSSWTIFLPSLKLLGQSVLELSVAQNVNMTFDLWSTDLSIEKDHLLIKNYLPTKFEASWAKHSLSDAQG